MSNVILRELNFNDEQAFFQGMKEWDEKDLSWYTFVWKPGMAYSEMLMKLHNDKNGINIPAHFVPASKLYGIIDDKTIIGRVSIRHKLNETLLRRGGHIGYSVAPRFRKKGYASEMMEQSILYCKKIGIEKLLVTCASDNIPSWRIIEKNGGILENEIYDEEDKEMIKRYWINL